MCGIVAAVSARANVVPILINGLRKLEYRGYDSAGVAVLQGGKMARVRAAGRVAELATVAEGLELGPYRHYMHKEIFEQPEAVANTLGLVGHATRVHPEIFGTLAPSLLRSVRKVLILACGTSYHAASTARYWIESLARLPCEVEIASEGVRVLRLPADCGELSPIAQVLPLQMLAYHTALVKGSISKLMRMWPNTCARCSKKATPVNLRPPWAILPRRAA